MPALPPDQALNRLASVPVVRLATVSASGQPHVVVTTFAVGEGRIFTAVDAKPKTTRDLRRLQNIRENPRVALLADHYEEAWENLWWIRADGQAQILTDAADMAGPIQLLADRYWQYRENRPEGPVIAITVQRWSGWSWAEPALIT
jgi:PPOX class probable F420-dependent enzyme